MTSNHQEQEIWVVNQEPWEVIKSPSVMLPIKMTRKEARFNQYRQFNSRSLALKTLYEDTELMSYTVEINAIKHDIKYAIRLKQKLAGLFSMIALTVVVWPIIKITAFRFKMVLNKTKETNPEWWI